MISFNASLSFNNRQARSAAGFPASICQSFSLAQSREHVRLPYHDMGRILMPIMQLELIYSKVAGVMLRLHELSVFDVEGFLNCIAKYRHSD